MELHRLSSIPRLASIGPSFLNEDPFGTPRQPASPMSSRAPSVYNEKAPPAKKQRRFQSTRLVGEYEKPWLKVKDPRVKYDKLFFYGLSLVGCAIGAYVCYDGWTSIGDQNYCLQFEDDFKNGINTDNWNHDIQTDGFGTGSFDWTTNDERNSYVDASGLHIMPTFTLDDTNITSDQLFNGYTLNLTTDGTCTSTNWWQCGVRSNSTTGIIINPVRSARLTTKGKQSLQYGKVEVTAKLPKGDWLWPSIWMMPETDYYGAWPASGEIDIMEARGNDPATFNVGRNTVGGTLHWGPNKDLDMYTKTTSGLSLRRRDFSDDFHTFGLVWSSKYIFTYFDSVLRQTLYTPFGKSSGDMYSRGGFGSMNYMNNGAPANPWASSPNPNAPFDMPFYLIMNLAVGATNGYFADGYGGKPWVDKANNSAAMFWNAKSNWESTWGSGDQRGMTVQSVKMWRVC